MKRLHQLLAIAALTFIFWPWALVVVEGVRWFFHLSPICSWDGSRAVFALVWPVLAFFVVLFFVWIAEL